MDPRSRNKFTLKIVVGYLVIASLSLFVASYIFIEFKNYRPSLEKADGNEKLIRTTRLLAHLYEAENLSKLALQYKSQKNIRAFSQKVDTISALIDSLKPLTEAGIDDEPTKLDSVQTLLHQKVNNSAELRKLRVVNSNNAVMDSILGAFRSMESDMGLITPESFVPDFDQLPPETQNSIREYVAILNNNSPDRNALANKEKLDTILQNFHAILKKTKIETAAAERSMFQKEVQIYRTDLVLSQKIRSIISQLEREFIESTWAETLNHRKVVERSTRMAVTAIIIGLFVVILFTFLISRDFWKVQQYREQLEGEKKFSESLLKSREQLISMVSHDLKTPLNTINGYSELMQHSGLDSKQQKYMNNVKSASAYVENLVNELLDFSKLEAGKMQLEKEPFDLSALIYETAAHFAEIYTKDGVELKLEIAPELQKPIIGDPFRIRQVLTNLVGNAFKFTDKGYVKISAKLEKGPKSGTIKIRVRDTGIGIAANKQELIFREFTQAEDSVEKKYGGYGLGLTISKKLTELWGGSLILESKVNAGSTFTIGLPYEPAPRQVSEVAPLSGLPERLSILILDDDEAMLGMLDEMCRINNIQVKTFSSFQALKNMESLEYDMVLTDIQMPGTDGFAVLQKLKEGACTHYSSQPVIAMTGQSIVNKATYLSSGFSGVLQKPFTAASFLEALAAALNLPENDGLRTEPASDIPESASDLFSVANIVPFMDGPRAVGEVLHVFIVNASANAGHLLEAIGHTDFEEIRAISHKMLPMFRQLQVKEAIRLLEFLEQVHDDANGKTVLDKITRLKKVVTRLETAIGEYLAILPVDIG